jgi:hypothetical protein
MTLRVKVKAPAPINTQIKKLAIPNLEELNNVDTVTNGLNDGYLLSYNDTTNQWVTTAANALDIDGGSY